MNTMQDKIADLQRRRATAELGGGADRLERKKRKRTKKQKKKKKE